MLSLQRKPLLASLAFISTFSLIILGVLTYFYVINPVQSSGRARAETPSSSKTGVDPAGKKISSERTPRKASTVDITSNVGSEPAETLTRESSDTVISSDSDTDETRTLILRKGLQVKSLNKAKINAILECAGTKKDSPEENESCDESSSIERGMQPIMPKVTHLGPFGEYEGLIYSLCQIDSLCGDAGKVGYYAYYCPSGHQFLRPPPQIFTSLVDFVAFVKNQDQHCDVKQAEFLIDGYGYTLHYSSAFSKDDANPEKIAMAIIHGEWEECVHEGYNVNGCNPFACLLVSDSAIPYTNFNTSFAKELSIAEKRRREFASRIYAPKGCESSVPLHITSRTVNGVNYEMWKVKNLFGKKGKNGYYISATPTSWFGSSPYNLTNRSKHESIAVFDSEEAFKEHISKKSTLSTEEIVIDDVPFCVMRSNNREIDMEEAIRHISTGHWINYASLVLRLSGNFAALIYTKDCDWEQDAPPSTLPSE